MISNNFHFISSFRFLVVFLLISAGSMQAANARQTPVFGRYDAESGLSDNGVNCIFTDKRGYLWFGTDEGLNRFDGYEMKHFFPDTTAAGNRIRAAIATDKSEIWVASGNKLYLFEPLYGRFSPFSPAEGEEEITGPIYCLFQENENAIWAGTAKGIFRISLPDKKISRFPLQNKAVYALGKTTDGKMLAGTSSQGLLILDSAAKKFVPFPAYEQTAPEDDIRAIYTDRLHNIWIGTKTGLRKIGESGEIKIYNQPQTSGSEIWGMSVTDITEDRQRIIWISSADNGIGQFNPENEEFTIHRNDFNNEHSLSHDEVRTLYTDPSGIVWAGTTAGLSYTDKGRFRFKLIQHLLHQKNSLIDNFVRSLSESPDGNIWIGTKGGLELYDPHTEDFRHFSEKDGLTDSHITAIFNSSDGKTWIGTTSGLNYMEAGSEKIHTFFHNSADNSSLGDNHIVCIYEDKDGQIWIGTVKAGLNRFVPESGKFIRYFNKPDDPNSLTDNTIRTISEDANGNLWVGTAGGGLCRFNAKNENFRVYKHQAGRENSLAHNSIKYLFSSSKGQFWIGSHGGLDLFEPATETFTHFSKKDGLPDNNVHAILEDGQGSLWISTNSGISKWDPQSREIKNFTVSDNLQDKAFTNGACLKSRDGRMYFGGKAGVNAFYPEKIRNNTYKPPLVISRFISENTRTKPEEFLDLILNRNRLQLAYEDNSFALEVSALSFRHPAKNRYQYFLKGYHKTWQDAGTDRLIRFTNLPADSYELFVVGSNDDGLPSTTLGPIKIIINPPMWESLWFRIFGLTVLAAAGFIFYKFRTYQIKKLNLRLEGIVMERTVEIRDKQEEILAQKQDISDKNDSLEKAFGKLEESNNNIRIISKIGQKVTAELHHDTVSKTVYENICQLMDADMFRLGTYAAETKSIRFEGFANNRALEPYEIEESSGFHRLAFWCVKHKKEVLVNDFEAEYSNYSDQETKLSDEERPGSLVYLPLMVEDELIGLMTIQSKETGAYSEEHVEILRTLAIYIAVATDNALTYGRLDTAMETISLKNEHITGSIRYAQRIQGAILPAEEDMSRFLPPHFLIYEPKDIVSGDFYWFKQRENQTFLCVADCTGHGVPGAFMSMIGATLLNEIVGQGLSKPGEILGELHRGIRKGLKQENNQNDDGMDAALCMWDSRQKTMISGAAKRPIYRIRAGNLDEIKPSRKSIGGFQREEIRSFDTTETDILPGDQFYLSSDGFADQNNPERMKFGSTKLKSLLLETSGLSPEKQADRLWELFTEFKQDQNLRDDVTLFGLHFPEEKL